VNARDILTASCCFSANASASSQPIGSTWSLANVAERGAPFVDVLS
jgi:hypothetical protein